MVAAGGDGTINEVAEGMVHCRVPLAILPGGTANVLAMEMKLGKKLERVAERLRRVPAAPHFGGPPDLRRGHRSRGISC